jgi:hypothetical protein
MSLVTQPQMQFTDLNGPTWAFSKAYFYETGTTTPIATYEDATYSSAHPFPVVADSKGLFPLIFLKPIDGLARMKVIKAGGSLAAPELDVDPVNSSLSITATDIADGAIEDKLGYVPVDPAAAVFTAAPEFTASPAQTVLNEDDLGFRHWRKRISDANYHFVIDDSQRLLIKDDTSTPTWTIDPHSTCAMPVGAHMKLRNKNTGAITLARGAGVALRIAGSATDANVSLAAWASVDLYQDAQDSWVVQGTGAS